MAKYIEQFDTRCSLEENIINQFFSVGGYFTEEQIKTTISNEKQSPALYNSILSAVATGHTKNSEIASFIGSEDISYPLKVLVEAELLEKRVSKKPYYILNDSMLEFWFRYVNKATSLINAGRGEVYYLSNVREHLHEFMGKVFEKMAREYLIMNSGTEGFPLLTDISEFQTTVIDEDKKTRQIEIDLLGRNNKEILLIGECKFSNSPFGMEELEKLLDKARFIPASHPEIYVFSLSGFTDEVIRNHKNCRLLKLDDMYRS